MGHFVFLRYSRRQWAGLAVLLGCTLVVGGLWSTAEPAWAAPSPHVRRSYRVRSGDTLSGIASRFRVSVSNLRRWNHLNSSRILPGQRLQIRDGGSNPVGSGYRVRSGDTLSGIASRFHVSVRELRRSNHLRSNRIVAGQNLRVPGHTTPSGLDPGASAGRKLGRELAKVPVRHFLALPPMYGSRASLLRQNRRADKEDLSRIRNRTELAKFIQAKLLVPLPSSRALRIDPRLNSHRRYCRPWTAKFLKDFAAAHYARFHSPIQVNSAVRTESFQEHLLRVNANAAPVSGDIASPHLTGEAVDIAKKGLSRLEIGWMRAYLSHLQKEHKIDVEEEFYQACFHISVYKSYTAGAPKKSLPPPYYASAHPQKQHQHHESSLLAAGLQ